MTILIMSCILLVCQVVGEEEFKRLRANEDEISAQVLLTYLLTYLLAHTHTHMLSVYLAETVCLYQVTR